MPVHRAYVSIRKTVFIQEFITHPFKVPTQLRGAQTRRNKLVLSKLNYTVILLNLM